MAYENLKLVIAGASGEVYLARLNKGNVMSNSRRVITNDCLLASTEWFMKNKRKMIRYGDQGDGMVPTLFYTADPDKAARILSILQEGEQDNE